MTLLTPIDLARQPGSVNHEMITISTIDNFQLYDGEQHHIFSNPVDLLKQLDTYQTKQNVYLESEELHRLIAYLLRCNRKLFLLGNRESIFSAVMGKLTLLPINQVLPYSHKERCIIGEGSGLVGDYNCLQHFNKILSPLEIGQSVGSTAFLLLETFLQSKNVTLEKPPESIHKLIRKAYYGGRTEIYRKRSLQGIAMDINSSYLHSMTEKFPVGKWTLGKMLTEFSVVNCTVHVSDSNYIGLLPYRQKNKHEPDRLYFPVGTWQGTFTSYELIEACNLGAQIITINWSINYETGDYILADYAHRLYKARNSFNPLMQRFFKLLGNTLAGKLAQDYNTHRIRYGQGSRGWFSVANINNLWARPVQYIPPSAHYQHAAFITSYARIRLLRELRASQNISYCDTDSVFCDQFSGVEGTELGQWKRVNRYSQLLILTGKQYAYQELESGQWKHTQHFESIEHFNNYFFGHVKLNPSEKKLANLASNRQILPDGNTLPYDVEELKRNV